MLVQVLLTFVRLPALPISFLDHLPVASILSHLHQDQRDASEVLVVVLVFPLFLPSLFLIVHVLLKLVYNSFVKYLKKEMKQREKGEGVVLSCGAIIVSCLLSLPLLIIAMPFLLFIEQKGERQKNCLH